MAEFNPDDSTLKWYNVLSSKFMHAFEPLDIPSTSAAAAVAAAAHAAATHSQSAPAAACKEESSDESTITSSQTSTLTRNQAPPVLDMQAQLAAEQELPASTKLRRSGMVDVAKMAAKALGNSESLENNSDESDDEEEDEDDDEEDDEDEELDIEVGGDYTKKMLDVFIDNMKQEFADKETNTECAFPPEKTRSQAQQQLLDDRPVKRSQTFTPSAAVGKSRYICRLNRSDSDSAMHFGVTPHPFHRGAVERRSLRFHTKATKSVTKLHQTHIPRTSLDLELDLQAQHSKLDFLNDHIEKLQNLKEVLEKARDNRDPQIAAWATENEEFQKLVERMNPAKGAEEKELQKLLMKTAKEIYKLRKTKVPKGSPDYVSFKEKISFFTRKGLSVPELPLDFMRSESDPIEEEEEEEEEEEVDEDNMAETAIAINTALVATSNRNKNLNNSSGSTDPNVASRRAAKTTAANETVESSTTTAATTAATTTTTTEEVVNAEETSENKEETDQRYEYVVDRTYGVEV